MCIAICYTLASKIIITHFTDRQAKLALVGQINPDHFLPWGRRLEEPGQLPLGGVLSIDKKQQGLYDQFFPKPVKIPVHKFLEANVESQYCWFEVPQGQYLQGLLLRESQEQRVYIVTFTPDKPYLPFQRWPLIISSVQPNDKTL